MASSERATGTRDEHYNLVSVLYHRLQEAETIQRYIDDARQAGDEELATFFTDVQEDDRQRAQRAKELLGARIRELVS
jgi:rubrerythrin